MCSTEKADKIQLETIPLSPTQPSRTAAAALTENRSFLW